MHKRARIHTSCYIGSNIPKDHCLRSGEPSLSTSGETLTIEVSMNLEGENENARMLEMTRNGALAPFRAAVLRPDTSL